MFHGEENVKRFILTHIGFEMPTPEIMADWEKWFGRKVRRDVQGQIDSLIGERTFYELFEDVSNP